MEKEFEKLVLEVLKSTPNSIDGYLKPKLNYYFTLKQNPSIQRISICFEEFKLFKADSYYVVIQLSNEESRISFTVNNRKINKLIRKHVEYKQLKIEIAAELQRREEQTIQREVIKNFLGERNG